MNIFQVIFLNNSFSCGKCTFFELHSVVVGIAVCQTSALTSLYSGSTNLLISFKSIFILLPLCYLSSLAVITFKNVMKGKRDSTMSKALPITQLTWGQSPTPYLSGPLSPSRSDPEHRVISNCPKECCSLCESDLC